MATKKAPAATRKGGAADLDATVEAPLEAVDAFLAEVEDAPPSTITVAVGSCGYYSGARPAETKAQYNTRLGAVADTFGDLGHLLGTKPKT